MLGFLGRDGPHHHLRAETVDHGQQSSRRDIGVCHMKLPGVDARANDLGDALHPLGGQRHSAYVGPLADIAGGVDLSTIGSAALAGLIYLASASFIES